MEEAQQKVLALHIYTVDGGKDSHQPKAARAVVGLTSQSFRTRIFASGEEVTRVVPKLEGDTECSLAVIELDGVVGIVEVHDRTLVPAWARNAFKVVALGQDTDGGTSDLMKLSQIAGNLRAYLGVH